LCLYGYLNRARSSRRLKCEAGRNLELMWLLKKLTPDHPVVCPAGNRRASGKTIADFRRDNLAALQQVCREFIRLCKELSEHPFGTIKRALGQGYFLMKGVAQGSGRDEPDGAGLQSQAGAQHPRRAQTHRRRHVTPGESIKKRTSEYWQR